MHHRPSRSFPSLLIAFAVVATSLLPAREVRANPPDLGSAAADDSSPGANPRPRPRPPATPTPVTLGQQGHGGLLFVTDRPALYVPAPSLDTDVSIQVTGLVTRARVRQRFTNPHDQWLEGIYVFPLPTGAAVDTLRMRIGERVVIGEIQEREAARAVYEQAKATGKKASLVEQERPNLFTTSVANVGPGETVDVEIEYQEELRWESGRFELRFPMVVNPRYVPGRPAVERRSDEPTAESVNSSVASSDYGWAKATDQVPDAGRITPPRGSASHGPAHGVTLHVEVDLGLEMERVTSPSHPLDVDRRAVGLASITLAQGQVPADRDFVLRLWPSRGSEPTAALLAEEHDGDTYYLLLLMPPAASPDAGRVPRETIFVLDSSGSMSGTSLAQAKSALLDALPRLPPGDTFNIIDFDSRARRLFDHPVPADTRHIGVANRWIRRVEAGGGTEILAACRLALEPHSEATHRELQRHVRQIVFITDGSVGNEAEILRYVDADPGRSRWFPIAIGSAPNGYFIRRLAAVGSGTATFITNTHEVSQRMDELFTKIEHPVLSDLELFWDDTSVISHPEHPGDLYLGEPLMITARTGSTQPALRLRGWSGAELWQHDIETTDATHRAGIHKLWARQQIAALDDRLDLLDPRGEADPEPLRQQMIELGLKHHLVSRFTSLVAVDTTPSRPDSEPISSRPLAIQPPAGWTPPGGVLPAGGTSARLFGALGLLLALLTLVVNRIGRSGS